MQLAFGEQRSPGLRLAACGAALLACCWVASAVARADEGKRRADEARAQSRPADDGDRPGAREQERPGPWFRGGPGQDGYSGRGRGRDREEDKERSDSFRTDDRSRGPRTGDGRDEGDWLTGDERKELAAFIKEHFPELHEKMQRLQSEDRPGFNRMAPRMTWPMLRLMRLYKYDPELAEKLIAEHRIEMQLEELRRDYREFPEGSAREEIRERIKGLLEQRFDVRQQRLELEIRALEQRLARAKERLDTQRANKPRLVDDEFDRYMEHIEDMQMWRGPDGPRPREKEDDRPLDPRPPGEPGE